MSLATANAVPLDESQALKNQRGGRPQPVPRQTQNPWGVIRFAADGPPDPQPKKLSAEVTQERKDLEAAGGSCLSCAYKQKKCDCNVRCQNCRDKGIPSEADFLLGIQSSASRVGPDSISLAREETSFSHVAWCNSETEWVLFGDDENADDRTSSTYAFEIISQHSPPTRFPSLTDIYNPLPPLPPHQSHLAKPYLDHGPLPAVPTMSDKKPRTNHAMDLGRSISQSFAFLRSLTTSQIEVPASVRLVNVKSLLLLLYLDICGLLIDASKDLSAFVIDGCKEEFPCCVRGWKAEFILQMMQALASYRQFLDDLLWLDLENLPDCILPLYSDLKQRGRQLGEPVQEKLGDLKTQLELLHTKRKATQNQVADADRLLQRLDASMSTEHFAIGEVKGLRLRYLPSGQAVTSVGVERAYDVRVKSVHEILGKKLTRRDTPLMWETQAQASVASQPAITSSEAGPANGNITYADLDALTYTEIPAPARHQSTSLGDNHASLKESQQDTDNETVDSQDTVGQYISDQVYWPAFFDSIIAEPDGVDEPGSQPPANVKPSDIMLNIDPVDGLPDSDPFDTESLGDFQLVKPGKGVRRKHADGKRSHSDSEDKPSRKRAKPVGDDHRPSAEPVFTNNRFSPLAF